jgi:hypothetical protein
MSWERYAAGRESLVVDKRIRIGEVVEPRFLLIYFEAGVVLGDELTCRLIFAGLI